MVSGFLLRKCSLAKGKSVTNSLGKRPLDHQPNSLFSVFSLSASDNILRDGILTKPLAPSRPGITGQWLDSMKCWLAIGLSVSHSLGKRPFDHTTNSLIGVLE